MNNKITIYIRRKKKGTNQERESFKTWYAEYDFFLQQPLELSDIRVLKDHKVAPGGLFSGLMSRA